MKFLAFKPFNQKLSMMLIILLIITFASDVKNTIIKHVPCNETVEENNVNLTKIKSIGPWSEILEDWIIYQEKNFSARNSRITKLGETTVKIIANKVSSLNKHDVSETDLYLLGAIEKLVYRIDFMEKRLKRVEELLYFIISGNNKSKDPCPEKYMRVGQFCYYFSLYEYNWKSSSNMCRGISGTLVEFETIEENQDMIAFLQSDKKVKNKNYWTGGLNPGLLWIWATSARPIHHDSKQNIFGDGRCLKLEYNAISGIYLYKGEDCGLKQRYICELSKDDDSTNKIEPIV